jgi:tRNA uridine 5-carbamoylmethylation protein Kti12
MSTLYLICGMPGSGKTTLTIGMTKLLLFTVFAMIFYDLSEVSSLGSIRGVSR